MPLDQYTEHYHATRKRILDTVIADPTIRHACEQQVLPCDLHFHVEDAVQLVTDAAKEIAAEQIRRRDDGLQWNGLRFQGIDFVDWGTNIKADGVDRWVAPWLTTSLPLRKLCFDVPFSLSRHSLPILLRHVFATCPLSLSAVADTEEACGFVDIECDAHMCWSSVSRVFSALARPSVVRSLHLFRGDPDFSYPRGLRAHYWRWIGFTFFSRFSKSNVTELVLTEECFTVDDAAAVREGITAANPLTLLRLHDQPRENDIPIRIVKVLVDATPKVCDEIQEFICQVRQMAGGDGADGGERDDISDHNSESQVRPDTPAWKEHHLPIVFQGDEFWLARDAPDSDTVDILVPGYGFCSIERARVKIIEPTQVFTEHDIHHNRHLSIKVRAYETDIDGLVPLIEPVGSSLASLTIDVCMYWSLEDPE